ncbi:MAG: phage portal protein [Eubacteriales bacterium]
MGLLQKLFGKHRIKYYFGSGSSRAAPFNKDLYEQEIVRAVIDCIATHAAKAEAMHVILDNNNRIKEIKRNSPYTRLLNEQPNPLMSGYDLKYRLVTHYERDTTAYCYIKWNGTQPEMILPVDAKDAEVYPVEGGGYAIKFYDISGEELLLPAEDMVILRKYYCDSEMHGSGNAPIYNTLDMLKASDEGLQNALSVSNKVRGLLKQKQAMLDTADIEKSTEQFAARFAKAAAEGGIVGIDSMEEYTALTVTPWAANSAQIKDIRDNILRYWRISESILTSKYQSNEWQSFYESVIEPILIQMSKAFTNTCFTPLERIRGNRILITSDAMIYMAMSTRIALISATRELGIFTRNEYRSILGYAPIEGGDEPLVSLNYIKSSEQSKYQTGEEEEKKEETDGQNEID